MISSGFFRKTFPPPIVFLLHPRPLNFGTDYRVRFVTAPEVEGGRHALQENFEFSNV